MVKRASLLVIVAVTAAFASNASASQLVDRNATAIKLEVNSKGEALLSYKSQGKQKHVLAWGAENAIAPTRTRQQIAFKLDYAGGWGKYHRDYWRTFKNSCGAVSWNAASFSSDTTVWPVTCQTAATPQTAKTTTSHAARTRPPGTAGSSRAASLIMVAHPIR